ncbi:hypothetical protein [Candidatus Methylopumilus universalis]|uniref:hypothetical protein n=1 Tax=Candidatus Methylopumilus universalis TaxID=2588536 RepID=UPI001122AA12|nr:hypothetical protein [Candidatus Methylopumilus universalis]QDC72502.1 hypothetical protein FIT75_06805 [Candidatus Methylopumilus universalis]
MLQNGNIEITIDKNNISKRPDQMIRDHLIQKGMITKENSERVGHVIIPPFINKDKEYSLRYCFNNSPQSTNPENKKTVPTWNYQATGLELCLGYFMTKQFLSHFLENPESLTEDEFKKEVKTISGNYLELLALSKLNPKEFKKIDLLKYGPLVNFIMTSNKVETSDKKYFLLARLYCVVSDNTDQMKKHNCVTVVDHSFTEEQMSMFKDNWKEHPLSVKNKLNSWSELHSLLRHGYVTYLFDKIPLKAEKDPIRLRHINTFKKDEFPSWNSLN